MKIFEKIKNTFSQIGEKIKTKFADKEQQYPNFVLGEESKLYFTDKIKFELGEYLKKYTDINDNPIVASINYLYNHHKNDMFISKREVYKLIKEVLDSIPEIVRKQNDGTYYFAKSLKQEKSNKKSVMADIVLEIGEAENYIKHLNKKPYSKEMREVMSEKEKAVSSESVKSSHSRQAAKTLDKNPALTRPQEPVSNLLTANDEIISQKSENSNITDKIHKIKPVEFNGIDIAEIDSNDTTALDEIKSEFFKKDTKKSFYDFRCLITDILSSDGSNGEYCVLNCLQDEKISDNEILEGEIYIKQTNQGYGYDFVVFRNICEVEFDDNGGYEVVDIDEKILHEFSLSDEAIEQIPSGYNAVHNVSAWENVEILEQELYENLKEFLPKTDSDTDKNKPKVRKQ